jgi:hypothetical protein
LLGERGVNVERERVDVRAEFGDDERHLLGHQTGNERDIAGQPIKLRDRYRALGFLGGLECGGKLWPAVERVGALAGFDLNKFLLDMHAVVRGELGAITTLAATILNTDKERAAVLNSFTVFAGLSVGTLGAGALVTYAPAPEQLVFVVLLVLTVVEAAILWFMPETATTKPGALASLRPRVHVPRVARAAFAAVTPVNIASWSFGGFYFSLMPSVVRAATGRTLPIVGGLVVATLTFSGAVALVALRKLVPEKMRQCDDAENKLGVLITLAGVQYQNVGVMLFGTVVGGTGFGTVFSGTLWSLLQQSVRAARRRDSRTGGLV